MKMKLSAWAVPSEKKLQFQALIHIYNFHHNICTRNEQDWFPHTKWVQCSLLKEQLYKLCLTAVSSSSSSTTSLASWGVTTTASISSTTALVSRGVTITASISSTSALSRSLYPILTGINNIVQHEKILLDKNVSCIFFAEHNGFAIIFFLFTTHHFPQNPLFLQEERLRG